MILLKKQEDEEDVEICALSGEQMKRSIFVTDVITFTQFISTVLK